MRRLVGLLVLAYVLGFLAYLFTLPKPLEPSRKTEAIVVLTGGTGRIDRGLMLLRAHAADHLLISGVDTRVGPGVLAHEYGIEPPLMRCCIDLGREAVDTRSNADETARWVVRHAYGSVRLVTSDWHMARARLELHHQLGDDVELVEDGVRSSPGLGLLLVEYTKLVVRWCALRIGIAG